MSNCKQYDADKVFKNLKVMEFPVCMVGLSTSQELDVGVDLNYSAYIKTTHEGCLMKYEEAQKISSGHRAFQIEQINTSTLRVTFKPTNECISKAKHEKLSLNRFIIDLRFICVNDIYCCNQEHHLECGRIYLSGQFEYCNITHCPRTVTFGDVKINTKSSQNVELCNESMYVSAHFEYVKTTGFHLSSCQFTINPKSSKNIKITAKPVSLKIDSTLVFRVRNSYSLAAVDDNTNNNFLMHYIKVKLKILPNIQITKPVLVESLHKLIEPIPCCTYIGEEIEIRLERKRLAQQHLHFCKYMNNKKEVLEKLCTGNINCYSMDSFVPDKNINICHRYVGNVTVYDIPKISVTPFVINFGKVGISTYAECIITLKNETKFDVTIYFTNDPNISYSEDMFQDFIIKLKSSSETDLTIYCRSSKIGSLSGIFQYVINHKFIRHHPYTSEISTPAVYLTENNLKFGMVTSDNFITSVLIRIFNDFNVEVDYQWGELSQDAPFEIVPKFGKVPPHSSKSCDMRYVCKPTKSKVHEVEFLSLGATVQTTLLELNIITRKISIKFLQSSVQFKDIPLNLETIQKVRLENSSREIAMFHVLEPLIPGITMEPMNGTIGPKMVLTLTIKAKIACILEFSFDIAVKINNKENVFLPITGNVSDPKLSIFPKNILMPRVPCNMVTYVGVTLENHSNLKTKVEVINDGDENVFDIYEANGNEKTRIFEVSLNGRETKLVYVKIYDKYRREYEQFIPFKINDILGPPCLSNPSTTELQYYTSSFVELYENNNKVKLIPMVKDIGYCRLSGVITVPWIQFSTNDFEIIYDSSSQNCMEFTMTNISKYYLFITVQVTKLGPHFSLELISDNTQKSVTESNIKFELDKQEEAEFLVKFHPKFQGRFIATALLYLDKQMSVAFHNLTFVGKKEAPLMEPSVNSIIFPPCAVNSILTREFKLTLRADAEKEQFTCQKKYEDDFIDVEFINCERFLRNGAAITEVTAKLSIMCEKSIFKTTILHLYHVSGSYCDMEVIFCFTHCPLTLHASFKTTVINSPFPYYPLPEQTDLYDYMEKSKEFLEKWMYQQGFRRDLYPVIPDTFHTISEASQVISKSKGLSVSYMNYIKRIAGPLIKHLKKITTHIYHDEPYKQVKEVHDTYREFLALLHSRGANLLHLKARFLLSFEQFTIFMQHSTSKSNAEFVMTQHFLNNEKLFNRLNKQCWIDFILQSYKVFILDSCFFECVCVTHEPRNIIQILINWYNEHISLQHNKLRRTTREKKVITNLTIDLIDGIAFISVLLSYCPFLEPLIMLYNEISDDSKEADIVNNACIIIEALNQIRLFFPISTHELMNPNYMQMLFFSVHLYVALPMFNPKEIVIFSPPLLRSSTRYLTIAPCNQETLLYTYFILNNNKNSFIVEKGNSESGKKIFIGIKYIANFVEEENATLIIHGYNKTRIFDTYIVFTLKGKIGSLNPFRKFKVTGPLYRVSKVDILVPSPFPSTSIFTVIIKDVDPTISANLDDDIKPKFYLRRLNIIDKTITLNGTPKDCGPDVIGQKVYFQMICLATHIGNSWIWFRSDVGEFFVRVTTQPRWDIAIDTLHAKVDTWPIVPCSCGEACECYRTTILVIPHRNELQVKALRYALQEMASDIMLEVFDNLIDSEAGKIILSKLLVEGGTTMTEVNHIFRREMTYKITARSLLPRKDKVTLLQHTDQVLLLPITIPMPDKSEKFLLTLTSECGTDVRTYKVFIYCGETVDSSKSSLF